LWYDTFTVLPMPRFIKKRWKILLEVGLIAGFLMAGVLAMWIGTFKMPNLEAFDSRKIEQSTKIYDRTGKILLYDVHQDIRRSVIPFEEMSRHIKNATVAIEDAEFYEHLGIKPTAILRAVISNLFIALHLSDGYTQGGSTITQQVVKNALLTKERTLTRKIKEWVLAIRLERELPKEKILEIYLNEIPYGGSIYGVEEASQSFFAKSASELTLAQAAYLAALPQAPTYYSPYGNHLEALEARKNLVLDRMRENDFISEEEYEAALAETVEFKPRETTGIKAPHFVFYVLDTLAQKYGEQAIEEQGFRVITTLDYELQEQAERIVNTYALENEQKFRASNAGLVALDPQTGQILSMVGSRNYFDEAIDGNFNVTTARRQPGSAFKPIVYATAFDRGYTADTILFDVPTQFASSCSSDDLTSRDECYSPQNYDGKFRGPMTLRNALAQSVNVPAVKILYLAGLRNALTMAKSLGIETLTTADRYGLTLVLGGGEVTLLDLTSAYGVFATEGIRNNPTPLLRIESSGGELLDEFISTPEQVVSDRVALTISDILSDNEARTPLYGSNSLLYFGGTDVAVKTGTTNDYRDVWTVGYTPSLAVGAWAGNNDNSSMEHQLSGLIITPLWRAFMDKAMEKYPGGFFNPIPYEDTSKLKPVLRGIWQGGETYIVDKISGKRATEFTPEEMREERVVSNVHTILYWLDKNDPRGPTPDRPHNDSQFKNWEWGVLNWKQEHNIKDGSSNEIPDEDDDVHKPNLVEVGFVTPKNNATFEDAATISVTVELSSKRPIRKVDYYVDGKLIGSVNTKPFALSFVPKDTELSLGKHVLKAVGVDTIGNRGEATLTFTVN
jgi:1A family penicillin-binding protein